MQLLPKFKEGDFIEVTNPLPVYSITGKGSIGIISKVVYKNAFYIMYRVQFLKMTGEHAHEASTNIWDIKEETMSLCKKYHTNLGKILYKRT